MSKSTRHPTVGNVTMWTAGTRLLCYPTPGIASNGTSTAAPTILNPGNTIMQRLSTPQHRIIAALTTNLLRPDPPTQSASSGLSTATIVALSVAIPLVVLTLLAATLALWRHVHRARRHRSTDEHSKHGGSIHSSVRHGSNQTASAVRGGIDIHRLMVCVFVLLPFYCSICSKTLLDRPRTVPSRRWPVPR